MTIRRSDSRPIRLELEVLHVHVKKATLHYKQQANQPWRPKQRWVCTSESQDGSSSKKLSALCAADPLQAMLWTGSHNQSRQWSLECYARPIYQCCVHSDACEALAKNHSSVLHSWPRIACMYVCMYVEWAHHIKNYSALFIVISILDWFALANYNYCQIDGASRGDGSIVWLSNSLQKFNYTNLRATIPKINTQLRLTCICGMIMIVNKDSAAQVDASLMHVLLGQLSEQNLSINSLFPQLTGSRA